MDLTAEQWREAYIESMRVTRKVLTVTLDLMVQDGKRKLETTKVLNAMLDTVKRQCERTGVSIHELTSDPNRDAVSGRDPGAAQANRGHA